MATTTRCARCGREIEAGAYLCPQCREEEGPSFGTRGKPPSELERRAGRWPPWMPKPSPVQYHATIMVTIFLVLLGLAVFALINHHGVGPFTGHVVHSEARPPSSLVVSAKVHNEGTKRSRSNCTIAAKIQDSVESSGTLLTSPIDAGGTISFRYVLRGVDAPPTDVVVNCS
jgi:hypothetical protein